MAQQTAISWLKDMLEWNYGDPQMLEITWENLDDLLEQAKQMEKEQIMDAYWNGTVDIDKKDALIEAEIFYKETYNK